MQLSGLLSFATLTGLLMVSMSSAQAQSSSASLTGFSYQLIDLDLNDGIAASLTLTPDFTWVAARGYQGSSGSPDPSDMLYEKGSTSVSGTFGSASAIYNDSGLYASQTGGSLGYRMAADAMQTWSFVLSANTTVIFTADASVVGSSVTGYAYANAGIFASNFSESDTYLQDQLLQDSSSESRLVSITFSSSQNALSGTVGATAGGSTELFSVSPVPEPSSNAMLVAGLALAGVCARRRRS